MPEGAVVVSFGNVWTLAHMHAVVAEILCVMLLLLLLLMFYRAKHTTGSHTGSCSLRAACR
eukprot:26448-Eustigmatos_ZCMA.PRE.1